MSTKNKQQSQLADRSVADAIKLAEEHPGLAEALLKQTLKHTPDHKAALEILGVIQHQLGKNEEAARNFERLTELDPEFSDNWANLGTAYGGMGQHDRAIEVMEKSVQMDPNQTMYRNNLALQYRASGRYEEAVRQLESAIKLGPSAELWDNLGGIYLEVEQFADAIDCYKKAVCLNPKFVPAQVNLSLAYHFSGDWKRGFQQYEWRFFYYPSLRGYLEAYDVRKKWDGKADLNGKRVLVFGEQGFGDIIMFSRFLKLVKQRGAHVTVHVPKEMERFMRGIEGVDETYVNELSHRSQNVLPEHDYQFALISAPHLLGVEKINGEAYVGFFEQHEFPEILNSYGDKLRVGVAWSGNPENPDDKERSIPFEYFERLSKIEGVQLFNLQFGGEECGLPDLTSLIEDFHDTATIVNSLDLVICCDTALAHVAGAVGIPVWDLIRYGPDWRWPQREAKTHWYESMTQFHQREKGNWSEVFDRVEVELRRKMSRD
jgi:tetratricopeptide (TPR) repeat protein